MNSLLQSLSQRAKYLPEDSVLEGEQGSMSVSELLAVIQLAAKELSESGASIIGLYADNCPEWIVLDLACQFLGVTLVPVPTFFSTKQLEHVLQSAAVELVVYSRAVEKNLLAVTAKTGVPMTAVSQFSMLTLAPSQPALIPVGTEKITFTSGSTGQPKGVCLSTIQCLNVADSLVELIPSTKPKHLCLLPLSTLLENIGGVYMPLLAGGCITVMPTSSLGMRGSSSIDADALIAAIDSYQPNTLILVPHLLSILEQALYAGWRPPASLDFIAVGGAKVSPSTLERVRAMGLPVFEGYGLSESASVVALNHPAANRNGSSGKLLKHVQARIENNEVIISGNAFLGYLNQPESWRNKCVATGDMGSIDSDGFLTITGRIKNLLISSYGRNINPEWIESELLAEAIIAQAVVIGNDRPCCAALIYLADVNITDQRIQRVIDKINKQLPDYARIGLWLRLAQPLSLANGLLTENGRPRRDCIDQFYAQSINQLYNDPTELVAL